MISGTTSHKLDKVKSYNIKNPYKVGANGVNSVEVDDNGKTTKVFYTIGNIDYDTDTTTLNKYIDINKSLVNINNGTKVEAKTNFKVSSDFSYTKNDNYLDNDSAFLKEEVKIGLVFPTKSESEVFIERQTGTVLEQHNRLSEITNLDELENYRNGYYNIKNNF